MRGLRQLDRALGVADKTLRSKLRGKLKGVAGEVAAEARRLAAQRTTSRTGDLVRGIQPFALQGRAGVRSKATHGGFRYPYRLEYEGHAGRRYGPRASLGPAAEAKQGRIEEGVQESLRAMERAFEGGA